MRNKHLESFPAEEADKHLGTTVSHKWNMPEGYDEHMLGEMIRKGILSSWDVALMLININPEMMTLLARDAHNTVWGMISRFNKDDIEFFISDWQSMWQGESGAKYREEIKQVEKQINFDLQWVCCKKTQGIILEHVKSKSNGKAKDNSRILFKT